MSGTPQSHFIELTLPAIESLKLHYLTCGNPENPAVLCVHGLTGNAHDFDFLADTLAKDYFVIAPDMPGRGLSAHLINKEGYNNESYLWLILTLLKELNIQSVHWIGASMGGILGMMACAGLPALVRSLMLNDVGSVLAKEGLRDILRYTSAPRKSPTDNTEFLQRLRDNAAPFALRGEKQWQHFLTHRTLIDSSGNYQMRFDPAVVQPLKQWAHTSANGIEDIDLSALWCKVHCPVLLFRGEHSLLLTRETALHMQGATHTHVTYHEIPVAGHMPNLMDEDQIEIVFNWLKQH